MGGQVRGGLAAFPEPVIRGRWPRKGVVLGLLADGRAVEADELHAVGGATGASLCDKLNHGSNSCS